jgi:hypothetical protein
MKVYGAGADAIATKAAAGPRRLAWLYVPNGIHMPAWTPTKLGTDYEMTPTLSTLAPFRDKMMVISGMVCDKANPNGDGPGDHARAQAAYLTGCQPRKTEGANIKSGISADQAAASKIGHLTKFASLEMGLEASKQSGSCDNGYSCAYSHNLSWKSETQPLSKDTDPQSVFDRLFSNGDPKETAEARARRINDGKSVLDFITEDSQSFQKKLGSTDKQKVDEYLTAVREIEVRLDKTANDDVKLPEGAERPAAVNREYPDHAKLMLDMMVLAFQCDLTRVITFPFADEGSNQQYPWADADVQHHGTSHHMGDPAKQALLQKINTFHLQQVAYLLGKLDAIKEGNGSLLDNCLMAYGSGNSDGQRHNHDDLPLLLLGKGGNTVNTGRHVSFDNVPINNLWLAMLDHAGAHSEHLGDSNGMVNLA